MTPNYSYLFPRPLFPPQSRSFSLWLTRFLNGCHPASFVSTLPKIEFNIIGLSAQIKKIPDPLIHLSDNSSSTTFTSDALVRNLGVTLILISLSPTTSPTSPAPASCTSVTSAASDSCLTLKPPPPLPPPSSILN